MDTYAVNDLLAALKRDGIVLLPDFLSTEQLAGMRAAFDCKLQRMRWNDVDGYEKTERHRHMVEDVLALDQGFVDAALHPIVQSVLRAYVGVGYELVEAKGWESLPTRRDFHGWHGDAWYDQSQVANIPREVKLGIYLTDVNSGFFQYVKGSHRKQHPRQIRNDEMLKVVPSEVIDVRGRAGCAFLFDTSGIHRQSVPILEQRYAVFLNYHDPAVPLQTPDVAQYRYHPLLLNAAFLGGLSEEDRRVLGFGNKKNYTRNFLAHSRHPHMHKAFQQLHAALLLLDNLQERVAAKLSRLRGEPIKDAKPGLGAGSVTAAGPQDDGSA